MCFAAYCMCWYGVNGSMGKLGESHKSCVTRAQKQKREKRRMGWHFHQKGQQEKATGQVKEATKEHSPVLCSVCVIVRPEVYFQLTSSLSSPEDTGCARGIQRPSEKVKLHHSASAWCDHCGQYTGDWAQVTSQEPSSNQCLVLFIMFPLHRSLCSSLNDLP